MAKASTGPTAPGKMKSAPRPAGKTAAKAAAAKHKATGKTAATAVAPKLARKSASGSTPTGKTPTGKAPSGKAPSGKPPAGKAPSGKTAARTATTPTNPAQKKTAQKTPAPRARAKNAPRARAKNAPAKSTARAKTAAAKRPAPKPPALQRTTPKQPVAERKAAGSAAAVKSGRKTVAAKTAAGRHSASRPTVPPPAARRPRSTAAPRKLRPASRKLSALVGKPPAATSQADAVTPRAPHSFTVSHLDQQDFKPDGLRAYALYRDLGIAAATAGLCQAHVIRFTPPCTDAVRQPHAHDVDLQLIYVLQGWMKNHFEGHGNQMMSAGSCWLQPSGIRHTVLDYSPDCEVLEIIVPADFKTAAA